MRDLADAAGLWLAGVPRRGIGSGSPPLNLPPIAVADTATVFAETPTVIDVLANDSDPEGGTLTLRSAVAEFGTVEVLPEGTLLYSSQPGFTGTDTVAYVVVDPQEAEATGSLIVTVAGPLLAVEPMADGTLVVQAASGEISLTVTAPPEFAGTFVTDSALIAGGPVNLVPPVVEGAAEAGGELSARGGLWIYGGEVTGEAWVWRRNGTAISGATSPVYTVGLDDLGATLTVVQALTAEGGSREAESAPVGITSFSPADDAGLVAWFDASAAATISASGSSVVSWANLVGPETLSATGGPLTGTRTIAGRNVIDFGGSARMTGPVSLPANGDVAIHAVIAIDTVVSAFSAPLSMKAVSDFQLDANNANQFDGRLNVAGIGASYALGGGPFSGVVLISILFDRTGAGLSQVFVNGNAAGSGSYTAPLDVAQTLGLMTNRNQNAFFAGAVAEVVVTGDLGRTNAYMNHLAEKWGVV